MDGDERLERICGQGIEPRGIGGRRGGEVKDSMPFFGGFEDILV